MNIYLGSNVYIQGPINNIYFKFHNFQLNEKLSLVLEYEYIDLDKISCIMYEYVTRGVKITIIKDKNTNLVDIIDIVHDKFMFKLRNCITACQYPIDGEIVCLILSNI